MTDERQNRTSDNLPLSVNRYRDDDAIADAIARMITALGRRLAAGDPDDLTLLDRIGAAVRAASTQAVAGMRTSGYSDSSIGEALGITKQAVQQRWPREDAKS